MVTNEAIKEVAETAVETVAEKAPSVLLNGLKTCGKIMGITAACGATVALIVTVCNKCKEKKRKLKEARENLAEAREDTETDVESVDSDE